MNIHSPVLITIQSPNNKPTKQNKHENLPKQIAIYEAKQFLYHFI